MGFEYADDRLTRYEPVADCCFSARTRVATGGDVTLAKDEPQSYQRRLSTPSLTPD
jgi:hypothetical protein